MTIDTATPRAHSRTAAPGTPGIGFVLYAGWQADASPDIVQAVTELVEALRELAQEALPADESVAAVTSSPSPEATTGVDQVRRAVLALAPPADRTAEPIEDGSGLRIGLDTRRVTVNGREVHLTRREFELLAFLARHPRRVFTRGQLLRHVWEDGFVVTRTVDTHVRRLRSKLGAEARRIETVRGVGYRLEAARGERLLADAIGPAA